MKTEEQRLTRTAGFISEMSMLPIHGGGVTLQRVLGASADRFDYVVKTIQYDSEPKSLYSGNRTAVEYRWWRFQRFLRPIVGCKLSYRIAFHTFTRRCFAHRVAKRLEHDCPDFLNSKLLVCPQAEVTLLVMQHLRRKRKIPYITWMMDDHLLRWTDDKWQYLSVYERMMAQHLQEAEIVYVISPALQQFYRSRFGVDSQVLCAPSEPRPPLGRSQAPSSNIKLAYFGSVGRWQNDALELLAPALERGNVSFDIYTHNAANVPKALRDGRANVCNPVPAAQVSSLLSKYDACVLPIGFSNEVRAMSVFNIATKFSEYLAAGIPALIIGPADAVMVEIAKRHRAAAVVDRACSASVVKAIDTLRDPSEKLKLVTAALTLLESEFSQNIMHSRWEGAHRFLFEAEGSAGKARTV